MKKIIQAALIAATVAVSAPAFADDHHDGDRGGYGHHHRHQVCTYRHHHRVCFWR